MSRKHNQELDGLRTSASELENHYIDELLAGRLDRRSFLRRGSYIGMSIPFMGAVLSASGASAATTRRAQPVARAARRGGTLRVAIQAPAAAVNPLTVDDAGGLCMLNQTGEFLIFDNNEKLMLQPMLATSWKPSNHGQVWTFKLRKGVTFHNGKPMTSADVAWTFQQLSDPANASNALSTFKGVLTPSGVKAIGSHEVQFQLEAPNGNFPYIVSSDNYNAIIVPEGTNFKTWQTNFIGTGAFKFAGYTQGVGASFVVNPNYWGAKPYLHGTSFKFFAEQAPQILALEGGEVDVIGQFVPYGATQLLHNSNYTIINLKSSNHRELSMRCDQPPFNDPRVRQAVAYTLNRSGMVTALLDGYGSVANDYPFAPSFPSTVGLTQRAQNIAMAKHLLKEAGHSHGFSVSLKTEIYQEIPQLAQVIKQNAARAGINIALTIENQNAYYGNYLFGTSDWLDGTMSLVDYGTRGVPNVFLNAPLVSTGPWNAARFKNPTYDRLAAQYVAALDLHSQQKIAKKIETLLLKETPIIYPYWIDGLTASTRHVAGLNPTSISQLYLNRAYFS
jgi:peptide/nickel transport system substrate-binding protein